MSSMSRSFSIQVHRLLICVGIAFDRLIGAVGQPQRDHPCHRSMLASNASAHRQQCYDPSL
jgi:hypothetical protein